MRLSEIQLMENCRPQVMRGDKESVVDNLYVYKPVPYVVLWGW